MSEVLVLNNDDLAETIRQGDAQRAGGSLRIKRKRTRSPRASEDDGSEMVVVGYQRDDTPMRHSPQPDNTWIEIPLKLHSLETYIFIGFDNVKAATLWEFWDTLQPRYRNHDGSEHSFLWYAEQLIHDQVDNPASTQDDWRGTLHQWGIRPDLIDDILDEAFTQVRLTQSLKDIVLETFHDAYNFLLCVRSVSDQRDSQRKSVRSSRGGRGDGWRRVQRTSTGNVPTWFENLQGTWASLDSGVQDERILTYEAAPGTTVLYRGTLLSNLQRSGNQGLPAFKPVWPLRDNSEPRFTAADFETELVLNTANETALSNNRSAPADFTNGVNAWYFTPQLEVAKQHARYANKRLGACDPVIVRFDIPNALFERKLPPIQYVFRDWESEIWKEFVWNRRQQGSLPKHLRAEIPYDTQLLIGPISRSHDDVIRGMASWQSIDHRHIYKLGEGHELGEGADDGHGFEVGIQYVFPMIINDDATPLMQNIFAQCKNSSKVCALSRADTAFGRQ